MGYGENVEFCTSAAVISASNGSHVALSQQLLSFLFSLCVVLNVLALLDAYPMKQSLSIVILCQLRTLLSQHVSRNCRAIVAIRLRPRLGAPSGGSSINAAYTQLSRRLFWAILAIMCKNGVIQQPEVRNVDCNAARGCPNHGQHAQKIWWTLDALFLIYPTCGQTDRQTRSSQYFAPPQWEGVGVLQTRYYTSSNYSGAHEDRRVCDVHLRRHRSARRYSRHRYLSPVHFVRSCNFNFQTLSLIHNTCTYRVGLLYIYHKGLCWTV